MQELFWWWLCSDRYIISFFPNTPHSSGAVWESKWTSWAVRPNEPSGFRGRKELLNRASALVTTCPCQLTSEDIKQHYITLHNPSPPPYPPSPGNPVPNKHYHQWFMFTYSSGVDDDDATMSILPRISVSVCLRPCGLQSTAGISAAGWTSTTLAGRGPPSVLLFTRPRPHSLLNQHFCLIHLLVIEFFFFLFFFSEDIL